jgi:hypothetical protein
VCSTTAVGGGWLIAKLVVLVVGLGFLPSLCVGMLREEHASERLAVLSRHQRGLSPSAWPRASSVYSSLCFFVV